MAFSRTARIWTLLIIDSVFLLIELVVGYAVLLSCLSSLPHLHCLKFYFDQVGSLALVADAFHMLK